LPNRTEPDVILLVGDLVDPVSELNALSNLVIRASEIARVYATPGNPAKQ